jgi:hypothetical protein
MLWDESCVINVILELEFEHGYGTRTLMVMVTGVSERQDGHYVEMLTVV